ncbi:L-gulonate 3-dehydrogenase [Paraburkholderia sp. WC7.3g]
MKPNVAIVGSGIIGCSWAFVWARAGYRVHIFDADKQNRLSVVEKLEEFASEFREAGLAVPSSFHGLISVVNNVRDAVHDAWYVQESVSETVQIKSSVFEELERHAPCDAILASSTSAIPLARFTENLQTRDRCIVAHPATPPHLLPVVEVVPGPWTRQSTLDETFSAMQDLGQTPVLVKKEVPNFVMNRLQGALLNEMFRLLRDDVISADHVDKLIKDGFGLRWAFLGPLEGVDLNAPGGIADYLHRFGKQFDAMAMEEQERVPIVTPELVDMLQTEMRSKIPLNQLDLKRVWRNRRIAALRHLRDSMET